MARGLILVARHPRPRIAGRMCYGRMDVPLAEPPGAAAESWIAAAGEAWIGRIISSPSQRALLAAQEVGRQARLPVRMDDRLMEMDFGTWEGQAWTALPRADIDAWAADPLHYRPGGGESVQDVLRRVRRAWSSLASAEETTLVVTHAGPIRCLLHIAQGVPILEAIQHSVAFGSVLRLEARDFRNRETTS